MLVKNSPPKDHVNGMSHKKICSSVFRLESGISETESGKTYIGNLGLRAEFLYDKCKTKEGYKLISQEEIELEKC